MHVKRLFLVFFGAGLVFFSTSVFASEISELAEAAEGGPVLRVRDRVLCVDGLKVFQTTAFSYGEKKGTGAAVSSIQLYEEKSGKVVPVRCE